MKAIFATIIYAIGIVAIMQSIEERDRYREAKEKRMIENAKSVVKG